MKFCPECGKIMAKITDQGGMLFVCPCQLTIKGQPDDTLMDEGYPEDDVSLAKHAVIIENTPHDPAKNVIAEICPQCNAPYLCMVCISANEEATLLCECGYIRSYRDHYAAHPKK